MLQDGKEVLGEGSSATPASRARSHHGSPGKVCVQAHTYQRLPFRGLDSARLNYTVVLILIHYFLEEKIIVWPVLLWPWLLMKYSYWHLSFSKVMLILRFVELSVENACSWILDIFYNDVLTYITGLVYHTHDNHFIKFCQLALMSEGKVPKVWSVLLEYETCGFMRSEPFKFQPEWPYLRPYWWVGSVMSRQLMHII